MLKMLKMYLSRIGHHGLVRFTTSAITQFLTATPFLNGEKMLIFLKSFHSLYYGIQSDDTPRVATLNIIFSVTNSTSLAQN